MEINFVFSVFLFLGLFCVHSVKTEKQKSSGLQLVIQKLKLLASKLDKSNCAALYQANVASRQCKLACTSPRIKPTIPSKTVPIFDPDRFKEMINCDLRPKQISDECAIKINLANLDKLGTEKVFFCKRKKFCRRMGLVLGSLESREKIDQLLNMLRSPRIKQFVDVSSPIGVWSSGSNLQKNSSHSFFWYDTFEPLSVEITSSLKSGIKSGKSVVTHMSLNNRQIKWESVDFVGRNFFFCEIPKLCFYETCLSKKKVPTKGNNIQKPRLIVDCVAGASNKCFSCQSVKKTKKEATENPAAIGRFLLFKKSKFFVSRIPKTSEEANAICCRMQMTLWAPENPDEMNELATTLYNNGYSNLSKPLLFVLNARDENCDRKFAWCDSRNEIVGPEYPWGELDPNDFLGNEVCLYFWLFPNRSNPIISDESCTGKKYFICESDEKYEDSDEIIKNLFVEPPVKFEALTLDCKNFPKCKPNGELVPNTALGVVFKGAGKTYFVSNDPKSYMDGGKLCCSMGMHYATVETWEEAQTIAAYLNNKTFKSIVDQRVLYVSKLYTKNDEPHWCATEQPVSGGSLAALPWMPGEPDNGYPAETIMWFFNMRARFGIADGNIFAPWQVLCQWP